MTKSKTRKERSSQATEREPVTSDLNLEESRDKPKQKRRKYKEEYNLVSKENKELLKENQEIREKNKQLEEDYQNSWDNGRMEEKRQSKMTLKELTDKIHELEQKLAVTAKPPDMRNVDLINTSKKLTLHTNSEKAVSVAPKAVSVAPKAITYSPTKPSLSTTSNVVIGDFKPRPITTQTTAVPIEELDINARGHQMIWRNARNSAGYRVYDPTIKSALMKIQYLKSMDAKTKKLRKQKIKSYKKHRK